MEKIKAFLAYLETTKFNLHRLANANLDVCYSNYQIGDLIAILEKRQELARQAEILSTDFDDGIQLVQITPEHFQRLTEEAEAKVWVEPSVLPEVESEYHFAEIDGIRLIAVRTIVNKKMQAQ